MFSPSGTRAHAGSVFAKVVAQGSFRNHPQLPPPGLCSGGKGGLSGRQRVKF